MRPYQITTTLELIAKSVAMLAFLFLAIYGIYAMNVNFDDGKAMATAFSLLLTFMIWTDIHRDLKLLEKMKKEKE